MNDETETQLQAQAADLRQRVADAVKELGWRLEANGTFRHITDTTERLRYGLLAIVVIGHPRNRHVEVSYLKIDHPNPRMKNTSFKLATAKDPVQRIVNILKRANEAMNE